MPATPAASPVSISSAATSTDNSVKIDRPPRTVAPEQRLRQQQVRNGLVIDAEGKWAPDCAIHRPCKVKPRELEVCERDAETWASLAHKAEHFTDPRVAIKGQLVMADSAFSTAVACTKEQCCNQRRASMVLAGPPYDLELVGLGCNGDESRLCCAWSAMGEEVIASGRLVYQTGRLLLSLPELCRVNAD